MPFGSRFGRIGQWWKERSSLEQILIVSSLIGIITIIVLSARPHYQTRPEEKLCNTPGCIKEAGLLLDNIKPNVKPCEDLYHLSCNKVFKKQTMHFLEDPVESTKLSVLEMFNEPIKNGEHKLVKTVKKLYQACMNLTQIEHDQAKVLKEVIKKVGGWPLLEGDNWNEDNFDWINSTYKLRELGYKFDIYFDISLFTDPENKNKRILMLSPSANIDFSYHTLLFDNGSYMRDIVGIFNLGDIDKIRVELSNALKFAEEMKKVNPTGGYYFIVRNFQKLTVEKYQQILSNQNIQLLEFINKIIGPTVQLSKDDSVLFPPAKNLTNWLDLISKTPKRTQANYMIWKVIEDLYPNLIRQKNKTDDIWQHLNREEFCFSEIDRKFPQSSLWIMMHRRCVSAEKKRLFEEMLQNIKIELLNILKKINWIDEKDKKKLMEKAKSVQIKIAIPDNYFDDKLLDQFAVDLIETKDEDFFSIVAQASRNQESMVFQKLINSEPLKVSFVTPLDGLPKYVDDINTLVVPAIVTESYLFDENRPSYLNYGSMGYMVGYRLTEVLYAKVLRDEIQLWSAKSKEAFLNKKRCLQKELIDFKFDQKQLKIENMLYQTIGEMVSYSAYQKLAQKNGEEPQLMAVSFTPKQLFWISVASTACKPIMPPHLAAMAIRSNKNFANDFNCPVNSISNYLEACKIF